MIFSRSMDKRILGFDFVVKTYLAKSSLSSCSETNCPRLATNSVEQGAFAARGGFGGWEPPLEPTGLARAGLGRKWPAGRPAET